MKMATSPVVRVSYPSVFTPRSVNGGEAKYSITLMFDKKNPEHIKFLKEVLVPEATKALVDKWPDETKRPRIPIAGHDKSPIKDGDKNCDQQGVPLHEKNPEYAGHWIVRAGSKEQKPVVDRNRQELMDKGKIYGGCFCKVNLNAYAFSGELNKGVTFGLNGVQFWADGDSFGGGRMKIEDMFDAAGADDPSNYSGELEDPLA
jgi:hypothetical protein